RNPSRHSPSTCALAIAALDRVLAEDSELAELWDETGDGPRWRRNLTHIQRICAGDETRPDGT
ncbi:DUF4259 domain-containing protein, partial [Embleya sp. NPDC050493]|uniref:DUF4259 domain-containing protein n=1 Tax=Embleya sp. NPDC050493 TaxID=3363989 RepID=UPI0037AA28C0